MGYPAIYINPGGNVIVNLAEGVGENAKGQSNAPDQPEQFFKGTKFWLWGFIGSDSTTVMEVKLFFDIACDGTTLSFAWDIKSCQNSKSIEIKSSCGRLNKNDHIAVFEEGMNFIVGDKMETVKNVKTKNEKHIVEKCHTGIKNGTNKIGENYYLVTYFQKLF